MQGFLHKDWQEGKRVFVGALLGIIAHRKKTPTHRGSANVLLWFVIPGLTAGAITLRAYGALTRRAARQFLNAGGTPAVPVLSGRRFLYQASLDERSQYQAAPLASTGG
jgi:hypothetical protein